MTPVHDHCGLKHFAKSPKTDSHCETAFMQRYGHTLVNLALGISIEHLTKYSSSAIFAACIVCCLCTGIYLVFVVVVSVSFSHVALPYSLLPHADGTGRICGAQLLRGSAVLRAPLFASRNNIEDFCTCMLHVQQGCQWGL